VSGGNIGGTIPHPKTCKPCKVEVKNKFSSAHMPHLNHTAGERVRGSFACKLLIFSRHSHVPLEPPQKLHKSSFKTHQKPTSKPSSNPRKNSAKAQPV